MGSRKFNDKLPRATITPFSSCRYLNVPGRTGQALRRGRLAARPLDRLSAPSPGAAKELAIGAGVGGGVGTGSETITKGDQVKAPSETLIDFTLQQEVSIPMRSN